ncbi:MAG: putative 4-hydroxybenzoate polyprenyltransferase [Nitrospiraceae bacterium]|nr:putative 4-hydroxybenzoate polyprenyltransferase [Nitrospiraceae bacterium]
MFEKITLYLRLIKFSHSIFALPFALTAMIIAASGAPSLHQIFWIIIAMVGARSGAMGLNRIIDRKIDAQNPRTANREIPAGKAGVFEAWIFTIISFVVLIFAAYMLNPLCLKLSPLAIAVMYIYPYTKRFTWLSHFVLGLSLSAAPLGAWIAVRGTFDWEIILMAVAVVFWLAGFDAIYALQDIEFDKSVKLYSIPKKFGIKNTLVFAAISHLFSIILLIFTGIIFSLGVFYWIGMFVVALLFIYEHSLLKHDDLSRLDMAFLNMNGYISMSVFIFTALDYIFR